MALKTEWIVIVSGNEWEIRLTNRIERLGHKEPLRGLCDPTSKTVFLRRSLPEGEDFETYVHEIAHALEDEYGIDIPHELIHKLEKPIADFIRDNFGTPNWSPKQCQRQRRHKSAKKRSRKSCKPVKTSAG